MSYKTDQENFWAGEFGREYVKRNESDALLFSKVALWSRMLRAAGGVSTVRELGCNIGLNLRAIKTLQPQLTVSGVEINEQTAKIAADMGIGEITHGTILEPHTDVMVDLTFTSGVLIHINPDDLAAVYANLVEGSKRYVLVAEYYNRSPVAIPYRGHEDRLFKRDFAGELIDLYGLKLIDYGFVYHRDNWAPQDDVSWFLMEK